MGRIGTMLLAALAAATGAPAEAEWLRATSRHFVIYSDGSAEAIRTLATRLERVDGALRAIAKVEDSAESAANPVTVYALDDASDVARVSGSRNVAGLYLGRASGAVAFTPRRRSPDGIDPQVVLFHEYAHHFLLAQSHVAYPAWLSEGYAEFVSTARIDDRGVALGGAANHRAQGLFDQNPIPIRTLLAPGKLDDRRTDQLYGRGWLLTHYLLLGGRRGGQVQPYLAALNKGTPPLEAATEAFGDLAVLDRELNVYMRQAQRQISGAVIAVDRLPAVKVEVRPLTGGERALVEMRATSTRGVDSRTAGPLHARTARAAAPFAADPVAQGWLAEMAYDAGRLDEAEAAADRALAADPRSVQALSYKAMVRLRRAAAAKLPADHEAWGEARSWIVKANRVETNAAAPLQLFYDSFVVANAAPRKTAIEGLHRAMELAPQDDRLRFASARQALIDGEVDFAKRTLRPLAFSPHAAPDNPAARLLAMVEGGTAGPAAIAALEAEEKASAAAKAKAAAASR